MQPGHLETLQYAFSLGQIPWEREFGGMAIVDFACSGKSFGGSPNRDKFGRALPRILLLQSRHPLQLGHTVLSRALESNICGERSRDRKRLDFFSSKSLSSFGGPSK